MVLMQSFMISILLSFLSLTECQNENIPINLKITSPSILPNSQLVSPEKSLNNFARRFLDDQINIANLGLKLFQSDGDFDSYNGNNNININSNRNTNFPWKKLSRNRFHRKSRDRSSSRLQDMQQQQLQQIFRIMMPEGSRSNRDFDLSQLNKDFIPSNNGYYRRNNGIRNPTFDKNCHNIEDDETYSKNIYSTFVQRIKSIRQELENIEDEFIQCCNRLYENVT
ncbi:uncharacterized protein [Chelonus insularis]|uniref:uncharacterized protein n=1 Tax=Chelonus insularis TaxID=460826 RepID=UPI0015883D4C|nr:uncharacterized protein LOC118064047 [Chelonus insularis]